jgi:hypothetical protein
MLHQRVDLCGAQYTIRLRVNDERWRTSGKSEAQQCDMGWYSQSSKSRSIPNQP